MIAVWLMNAFDLSLTIHAHQQGLLDEYNPVANAILPHGPLAIVLFKIILVGMGSIIFLCYRRRLLVECITWGIAFVYLGVCLHWTDCYEMYEIIVYTAPPYQGYVPVVGMLP